MPRYNFVLDRHDMLVLVGTLEYSRDDLTERLGELDSTVTTNRDEYEAREQEIRVINIVLRQYSDQTINGPMVGLEVRLDQTEPLQAALVTQLAYLQRQVVGYARLVATAPESEDLVADYRFFKRQYEALSDLVKQVGRHV